MCTLRPCRLPARAHASSQVCRRIHHRISKVARFCAIIVIAIRRFCAIIVIAIRRFCAIIIIAIRRLGAIIVIAFRRLLRLAQSSSSHFEGCYLLRNHRHRISKVVRHGTRPAGRRGGGRPDAHARAGVRWLGLRE
eukprot:332582-Pleurochrysis_carterae.AAC.1